MRTPVWIAGSWLMLAVVQTAVAQQTAPPPRSIPERLIRFPEHLIGVIGKWLPHHSASGDDDPPSASADKAPQTRRGTLTAAERLQLRQDVNEAGRDYYQHEPPAPGH